MWLYLHAVFLLAAGVHVAMSETGYIEYLPGTLNMILSSPHGGTLVTDKIKDRVRGCYINGACVWLHDCGVSDDETKCKATVVTDTNTLELTREVREGLYKLTGKYPHVIINKLKRTKMDPNRAKPEAAFGDPLAEQVWEEYHGFMEKAKAKLSRGIMFDIHGHGRSDQWAMLGYLLTGTALEKGGFTHNQTSIRALVEREGIGHFEQILRGADSFGAYMQANNFDAVPSPTNPHPGGRFIFSGGYITRRYGSRSGGQLDGIQIESPSEFIGERFNEYATGLATAMLDFYSKYYSTFTEGAPDVKNMKNGVKKGCSHNWLAVSALALSIFTFSRIIM